MSMWQRIFNKLKIWLRPSTERIVNDLFFLSPFSSLLFSNPFCYPLLKVYNVESLNLYQSWTTKWSHRLSSLALIPQGTLRGGSFLSPTYSRFTMSSNKDLVPLLGGMGLAALSTGPTDSTGSLTPGSQLTRTVNTSTTLSTLLNAY